MLSIHIYIYIYTYIFCFCFSASGLDARCATRVDGVVHRGPIRPYEGLGEGVRGGGSRERVKVNMGALVITYAILGVPCYSYATCAPKPYSNY